MKKNYKNILFDWDGCILHTLGIWMKGYKKGLHAVDVTVEEEVIARELFPNWNKAKDHGVTDMQLLFKTILDDVSHEVPLAPLHNNVLSTLIKLKEKQLRFAIVTSSERELILPALKRYNLEKHFEYIVTRFDVENMKPHPEPVEKALKHLQAKKEETIMIGDSQVDILAGKAAGTATIWYYPQEHEVMYSYDEVKDLEPDFIIRDFAELLEIV